jgi:hypothetical protein
MTRVITIRLEIPEGVEVRFGGGPPDDTDGEPLPPPTWVGPAQAEPEFRTIAAARNGSAGGSCPIHGLAWKTVPAGISRRTNRAYEAFMACPEQGCDQKPPVIRRSAS